MHLKRGGLEDGLVFDAVGVRLIEIGEAVKDIDPDVLEEEPANPWRDVAGMRDHLAHRCFDTTHSIVQGAVDRQPGSDCRVLIWSTTASAARRSRIAGSGGPAAGGR